MTEYPDSEDSVNVQPRQDRGSAPQPRRSTRWIRVLGLHLPVRHRADGSGLDARAGCHRDWRVGPLSVRR